MSLELFSTMQVVSLPTKTNFRGIDVREVALFKGEYGWSEFSPFIEYGPAESAPWLASAIAAATKSRPHMYRNSVRVNGTIPALNEKSEIERIVASFPGVKTFKVKVGDNLEEDIARLLNVRRLSPDTKLRVDVNGSWDVPTALTNLQVIFENIGPLEYVEQPCETIEELRELKDKLKIEVPIAGDEVLRKSTDPFALNLDGAVDILMLKVQPLGGIERAHKLAIHHNLPVVISSALESAVGINFGLQLAASFKELNYDCGLGTGSLLASDVAHLQIKEGEIEILEVTPDIAPYLAAPERQKWWQDRVMQTWELIK
ncbi:MAG: o-succinylbenzoate synthase [Candidatus Planktophila sp.]|tara:strand:+ start:99 stop:1046 length:948 start_codon:yes stop_codon:yes gene_type:complete